MVNGFLFRGTNEESCPLGKQCVENSKCPSYITQREELIELAKAKVWNKYYSLRDELKSKVCNSKKRKICCECPCAKREDCSYIQELYEKAKENKETLRSLVCNRRKRTFYCCNKENRDTLIKENQKDENDSPTFLPSAG